VLPLASLRPARVNSQIYRPVSEDDPELRALAEDIRENGLLTPLAVSKDMVIISGHRRRVACQLVGIKNVKCQVLDIVSTDPAFIQFLVSYNKQRIKTNAELIHEEVVQDNPKEARRALVEHRQKAARVNLDTIRIEGHKRRAKISSAKAPFLEAVITILEDYRDFLPLSIRQIHYYLLNDPPLIHAGKPEWVERKRGGEWVQVSNRYINDIYSYNSLDELVTRARLDGHIPWDAIADETRPVVVWDAHRSIQPFVRAQLDDFLQDYARDLMQSQPNHIEIIGEKNTIQGVISPVAMEYCIPYTIGRGYASLPPRHKMAERFRHSGKENLVVLALSDFDPEGEDIAHSFARSMRDDFGIKAIKPVKVALTGAQVRQLHLPPTMKAKSGSSRHKGFVARHGDDVFELEAVTPDRLQGILRRAIDSVIDVDAFNAEINAEEQDAADLERCRRQLLRSVADLGLNLNLNREDSN
jgi:hypothetical protein